MIELQGIGKTFRKGSEEVRAVSHVDLGIEPHSIVALIGPSGCGKSTLLNMIAGLYPPSEGRVFYQGQQVSDVNTDVGYMTQKDNLLPWRTVLDNVALPLELAGQPQAKRYEAARAMIRQVGLDGFENKYSGELSGGMRKRVGLARCLVLDPGIVLCDEPDSGLDPVRTALLGELLVARHAAVGGTMVVVTHNTALARLVSDYAIIVWRGTVVEAGASRRIWASEHPFVRQLLKGGLTGPLDMEG
jgi:NitT/TauT family transport system ATP-binding protein